MSQVDAMVQELKVALKAKGLSYEWVAREMNMSLGGVKRAFAKQTFSMHQFEALCNLVGLSMRDILRASVVDAVPSLSLEQETALEADEDLFTCFYLAQRGLTLAAICGKYDFTEKQCLEHLRRLDRLNLLELHRDNRIRLIYPPNIRWRSNGPLNQKYRKQIIHEFFAETAAESQEPLFRFAFLSEGVQRVFEKKLRQLAKEFLELSDLDSASQGEPLKPIWLLAALRPWSFSVVRKKRRK